MSLILSGTDGLSDVDGSAATPAIRGTDTNTGIFFPAADTIAFAEGGAESMRIDASGNLGLGTTSPVAYANYKGLTIADTTGGFVHLRNTANTQQFELGINGGTGAAYLATYTSTPIQFLTNSAERMRIDSSGNLGLGVTPSAWDTLLKAITVTNTAVFSGQTNAEGMRLGSNWYYNSGFKYQTTGSASRYDQAAGAHSWLIAASGTAGNAITFRTSLTLTGNISGSNVYPALQINSGTATELSTAKIQTIKQDNNTTTSNIFVQFLINDGANGCGQITANGANTAAFGSYSDERLKENVVDLEPQLANIMSLRAVEFDYIESEGGGHQVGFIAQNMEQIYPDVVGEREDGMKMIAGWSKTEARLVKAIQEQQALITTLTARITALESA
jgi:hypothetical protein